MLLLGECEMAETSNPTGSDRAWEEIFRSREWGKYPPEHLVRFIAGNFYGVPNRGAVGLLEIGCGPGANAWFMARAADADGAGFLVIEIEKVPGPQNPAGKLRSSS